MPQKLNTLYISKRLEKSLLKIKTANLTTLIAPMGYGKTTAINWYLNKISEEATILKISIYSNHFNYFWQSFQNAFSHAQIKGLEKIDFDKDLMNVGMIIDLISRQLKGEYYLFIDDYHLMNNKEVTAFLILLACKLPSFHLIIASRNTFLTNKQIVELGGKLYTLTIDQLCLNKEELSIYTKRCGLNLTRQQLDSLFHSSEGWFSAVYLNLCTYLQKGILLDQQYDIYEMFYEAMIEPLNEHLKNFVIIMGLTDEFDQEMAEFILQEDSLLEALFVLTKQNAFVSRLNDGKTYRFHHLMKECAIHAFNLLPVNKQKDYLGRYGLWYEKQNDYIHALQTYKKCENNDAMLRVIQKDAGVLMTSLNSNEVLAWLNTCSPSLLKQYPIALLILMRSMFNWKQIPKMLELRDLLMTSLLENKTLSKEERANLQGECDLTMSFLMYNDIKKMSEFHRKACLQMTRPTITIQTNGGWTFGSPSVLMMFHRKPGLLKEELKQMQECMPYYYQITNNHGLGAQNIMLAEAYFMQGKFNDAKIELEKAYQLIEGTTQENMALCCDFLALRLYLVCDFKLRYFLKERYHSLEKHPNGAWLKMFYSICSYYYALLEQENYIPDVFKNHELTSLNLLAPAKPMLEMIENQVYLIQQDYPKVIARSSKLLEACQSLNYSLVAIHIQIQSVIALNQMGKKQEALILLEHALQVALPDRLLLPFVENYVYLESLIPLCTTNFDFINQICLLGQQSLIRKQELKQEGYLGSVLLTQKEQKIVELMLKRLSNKEIARELYLSEGSVKQYLNQIYAKLEIEGDVRNKRSILLAKMKS